MWSSTHRSSKTLVTPRATRIEYPALSNSRKRPVLFRTYWRGRCARLLTTFGQARTVTSYANALGFAAPRGRFNLEQKRNRFSSFATLPLPNWKL